MVNSLPFVIRNFHPYSSKFVLQHVTAAVQLTAAINLQQKSNVEKKTKANMIYMKKRKQTENGKTPGSEQPVVKSVCGSLTMRWRAAMVIIVRCWMHNLQLRGNHERSTLHEPCIKTVQAKSKKSPSQTDGARTEKLLTQQQREKMILPNSECHC